MNEYDRDLAFANWNPFYTDLTNEITNIRKVGNAVYFQPENINLYFANIKNLFYTHKAYVDIWKKIEKELDIIEKKIFSPQYLKFYKNKKTLSSEQQEIINKLMKIFGEMCFYFSENKLLPKVEYRKQKYSKKEGLTDDERERAEALEEVGIM